MAQLSSQPPSKTENETNWLLINDQLRQRTNELVRKRIEVDNDEEFVTDIILERDEHEYPDPYLRNITDIDLLRTYRKRVRQAVQSYEAQNETEQTKCEEFLSRESTRVSRQIGRVTFPKPDQWGFSREFIDKVRSANATPSRVNSDSHWNIDYDLIDQLYNLPLQDLRYLSAWCKVLHNTENPRESKNVLMLNSIRFAKNDPTITIENILRHKDLEEVKETKTIYVNDEKVEIIEGEKIENIIKELNKIANKYSGLIPTLGWINLRTLENYTVEENSRQGEFRAGTMNISSVSDNEITDYRVSFVAHEFFHSIQEILGLLDLNNNDEWIDIEQDIEDIDEVILPEVPETHPRPELQERMFVRWEEFCKGTLPDETIDCLSHSTTSKGEMKSTEQHSQENPLREYQKKNFSEFYAVAFELFFENEQQLRKKQPEVYQIISDLMA